MRILVLGDVPPWVIGGAEMQTWRLVSAWRERGHHIEIAGHRVPSTNLDGLRLWHVPVLRNAGRALRGLSYATGLAVFLARHGRHFDLIYSRFLGEAALVVAVLKKLSVIRLPLFVVPAAGGGQGDADTAILQSLPMSKQLIRLLSDQVDCVNYIAPTVESDVQRIGFKPEKVSRIPNGVPLTADMATAPIDGKFHILFVGRLVEQKGLDILIQALGGLRKHELQVTIVGDGPLRKNLERLAQSEGISRHIEFSGVQEAHRISDYLCGAHLFVLPSRYEGLSNAALEAMAHGVPVILTRCGGIDTFIDNQQGWVCEVGDIADLRRVLDNALSIDEEEWRQRSRACRKLVETKLSIDAVADSYLERFALLAERT